MSNLGGYKTHCHLRLFQKLFRQTFVYGLATVLPRMLSFLLVPLYTDVMQADTYGTLTIIFTFFALFNVVLAYGMETAFFRFYALEADKERVLSTSLITLLISTMVFLLLGWIFRTPLAGILNIEPTYFTHFLAILALDALVIVPFARLRAIEKPGKYALIKIANVTINIFLNLLFLLLLPAWLAKGTQAAGNTPGNPAQQIQYILIAMSASSAFTLLLLAETYYKTKWRFDFALARRMLGYGFPVMIAGIAFTVNEVFDKYLLSELLPMQSSMAKAEVGKYAACYKLAMFMTLFATAFRLGIEPFFFAHASSKNPKITYAHITRFFVIFGSIILLTVIVFSDLIKTLIIRDPVFWEAMDVVPIVLTASLFLGIYHNLSVWYKITDRTRFGAVISLIGAGLTLGINVVFIPVYGYMASAWATLAAYGSMMILSYILGQRYYPIPYNTGIMFFYLGLSLLFSILSFYVFNRDLFIGLTLLVVFLTITYMRERKELTQLIRSK